jgi:hypothetical protein
VLIGTSSLLKLLPVMALRAGLSSFKPLTTGHALLPLAGKHHANTQSNNVVLASLGNTVCAISVKIYTEVAFHCAYDASAVNTDNASNRANSSRTSAALLSALRKTLCTQNHAGFWVGVVRPLPTMSLMFLDVAHLQVSYRDRTHPSVDCVSFGLYHLPRVKR